MFNKYALFVVLFIFTSQSTFSQGYITFNAGYGIAAASQILGHNSISTTVNSTTSIPLKMLMVPMVPV